VIVTGFFIVWKPQSFLEMMGEQKWMIKLFGPGHGTTGYKTLGLIIVLVGFLIMFQMVEGILYWFFGPILN